MFEQRTEFVDNTFYDVSAWTLPRAFNLPFAQVNTVPERGNVADQPNSFFTPQANASAYIIKQHNLAGSAMAMQLLNEDVGVYRVGNGNLEVGPDSLVTVGDFVIPMLRGADHEQLQQQLATQAQQWQVPVQSVTSGFNTAGLDLGSPNVQRLKTVKPLMVVGRGVSPMEAGHIWHLVDRRLGLPLPMLDVDTRGSFNLDDYTHLLIPDMDIKLIPESWYPQIVAVHW